MIELSYVNADGQEQVTNISGDSATNIISVDPTIIKTDRMKNTRGSLTGIKELAESINANGQLAPVICVVDNDGELSLVAGFRRHAAVMYIRENYPAETEKEILVQVVNANEASQKAVINITENMQREALTGMEQSRSVNLLLTEYKLNRNEIAKIFGKSAAWVSNIKCLVQLPEEFQKAIEDGKLPEQAGYEISKMSPEKQAEWLKVLKEKGEITYQEVHGDRRTSKASKGGDTGSEEESDEATEEVAVIRPRPGKVIAAFFDLMGQADNDKPLSEDGQKFAKTLAKFAAGKIGEKPVIKALREQFPSE